MRNISAVLLAGTLLFASFAHATLIDNGSFTSDTATGLDWLDWTATTNVNSSQALAANPGWCLATSAEANALMSSLFPISWVGDGHEELGNSYQGTYDYMESLFGLTCGACADTGVYAQVLGYGIIGARDVSYNGGIFAFNGFGAGTYGVGASLANTGHALVRSSVAAVPEPPVLAVLGLGLVLLRLTSKRRLGKVAV